MKIEEMILNEDGTIKKVTFSHYENGALWYVTETGFQFPVPLAKFVGKKLSANERSTMFIREISKQIKMLARRSGGKFDHLIAKEAGICDGLMKSKEDVVA